MFNVSSRKTAIRLSLIAGVTSLAFGSLTAGAQAGPVGPAMERGMPLVAVQYYNDGYAPHQMSPQESRHHRRAMDRYGENYHPAHPGHAGLYDCGPGGKSTRLSRKACSGNDRFAHIDRYYYE